MKLVTRLGGQPWRVVLALMVGLAPPVLAADYQFYQLARKTLTGFTALEVVVEEMNPDPELQGLTQSTLRTDVELKLRQAGIRVLTQTEALGALVKSDVPGLHLAVGTRPLEKGNYAFGIQLELLQTVLLERDRNIISVAPTWEAPIMFGTIGAKNLPKLREYVRDMVDQFINAYLAANPKR